MIDETEYTNKLNKVIDFFKGEVNKIRTGRANPSMISSIMVEVYGTKMPLMQLASISVPEPRMLFVSPFDIHNLNAITKAIQADQSLGLNPADNGKVIRIPVPALTEESRKQIVKQAMAKAEDSKIEIRSIRQDVFKQIKKMNTGKELSDDEAKRLENEVDKDIKSYIEKIDEIVDKKQKEIMSI